MEDQYGMPPDLRQYIAARPNFYPPPGQSAAADLLSEHDMVMFRQAESTAAISNIAVGGSSGGLDGSAGSGRWPRQETLTLLEIRLRLDSKFKEANQKGPLWDDVSRIMSEEYGYQRSGKKCREKFENLNKYYKKTREGKASRQEGKHYRFFRQLEALCGENNNNNNNNNSTASASEANHQPYPIMNGSSTFPYDFSNKESHPRFSENTSLSLSNFSEPDTMTSSDNTDGNNNRPENTKRAGKTGWKVKVKDFIDLEMKSLMKRQEAWMEKMMKSIEGKERERLLREEEWRKQDVARIEREHRFWAGERAWIAARDAALMDALHKLMGKDFMAAGEFFSENEAFRGETWLENEQRLWEEMGVNSGLNKCGKKRKEYSKGSGLYVGEGEHCENGYEQRVEPVMRLNDQINNNVGNNNSNGVNVMSESCFRYFIGDGYGRIME